MAGTVTPGRRRPDSGSPCGLFADGEYGRIDGVWHGRPPGHHLGSFGSHDVVEHEDGTITVSPSILITAYDGDCAIQWHGYLERGVWREC